MPGVLDDEPRGGADPGASTHRIDQKRSYPHACAGSTTERTLERRAFHPVSQDDTIADLSSIRLGAAARD
jgi:hypothetical protein